MTEPDNRPGWKRASDWTRENEAAWDATDVRGIAETRAQQAPKNAQATRRIIAGQFAGQTLNEAVAAEEARNTNKDRT